MNDFSLRTLLNVQRWVRSGDAELSCSGTIFQHHANLCKNHYLCNRSIQKGFVREVLHEKHMSKFLMKDISKGMVRKYVRGWSIFFES